MVRLEVGQTEEVGVQRVDAPDGRHWAVRRQWAPRLLGRGLRARIAQRRRRRRGKRSGGDAAEAVADSLRRFDEGFVAMVGIVLLVGVFVLLFTLGLPLVLALVDLMVVVALVVGGVVARVLFRCATRWRRSWPGVMSRPWKHRACDYRWSASSSGGRNSKLRSPRRTRVEAIHPPMPPNCSSRTEPSARMRSSRATLPS